jgi:hypothetical protein
MSSGAFDVRMKLLEDRVDKAEGFLDSVGRVLHGIERAHNAVERRGSVPLLLLATTAAVAASIALVARRQQLA